jgi:hypothetical protein
MLMCGLRTRPQLRGVAILPAWFCRLLLIAGVGSTMGCSINEYSVARAPHSPWLQYGDWPSLTESHRFPRVERAEQSGVSEGVQRHTYYTGRRFRSGWGLLAFPAERERFVVEVRQGKPVALYSFVQVVDAHTWWAFNISGHGELSGSSTVRQCEEWGLPSYYATCPKLSLDLRGDSGPYDAPDPGDPNGTRTAVPIRSAPLRLQEVR